MAKSICIEGIDGSGKGTQIERLKQYLEDNGKHVLTLKEPGGTEYYQAIREHVHFKNYERPVLSDALTCAGGIVANIAKTKEALAKNAWVISDRSFYSNTVYQTVGGVDNQTMQAINAIAVGDFSYDFKILIDVPVEVGQSRLESIGKKKDRYESLGVEYFRKIRDMYLDIAKKDSFIVIDGTQSIDEVHRQIIENITI